jgi:crotonobetainyl-CoA:carnitine CoA-transferase CaiB-like acyl-CoA transferase
MSAPLAGRVAVEASGSIAVRYCGRLLADHGATVIRAGDAPPLAPPATDSPARRAFSAWLDAGKARGREPLASHWSNPGAPAHLVLAGPAPREVERIAAQLQGASAQRPLLVGVTAFGHDGPYRDWLTHDALIPALTGSAYAFGDAAGPPTLPQGHAPQMIAGVTAYVAAVAALIGRGRGRVVERVDVSIHEANLCFTETGVAGFALGGPRSMRRGVNRYSPTYPAACFQTARGWIGVTALTPPQWGALCELVGLPALAQDPRLATAQGRLDHADEVEAALAPAFLARSAAEWLTLGQARRIPFAPVPTPAELLATPHWRERGSFRPVSGTAAMGPAAPFRMRPLAHPRPEDASAADNPGTAEDAPNPGRGVLAGIRVLDLSMGWAGPLTTRHLADLGADVIKVEACSHMDWWRGWDALQQGDPPPHEMRPNFAAMNRNKRGVALEMNTPQGLELVRGLAARSHLLVENFAPGALERLELGPGHLAALHPGLLYLSMGGFGHSGPWRDFRAYGSTTEQASGLPFVNGQAHWPPSLQHVAYGDAVAGLYGAAAAVTALHGRTAGGGQHIDLSQVECLFQLGADAIVTASLSAGAPRRTGSRRTGAVPCGCFPGRDPDTWVALAVETGPQWQALCGLLGRGEWAGVNRGRLDEDEIEAAVGNWTARRPAVETVSLLQAQGVPAAEVTPTHALLDDPHLVHNGCWPRLERRHIGRHVVPAAPYRLDGQRPVLERPAPTLGEHNDEVLTQSLGLTPARVQALAQSGIIGSKPTLA